MTRLRTDQACLDAQVRAQVEQKLNAERARDTERCPPPDAWTGEGSSIRCPICDSAPGEKCRWDGVVKDHAHWLRGHHEGFTKTPDEPARAPLLMPVVEVSKEELRELYPEPPRPVCACGQTVWRNSLDFDGSPICGDCANDMARACLGEGTTAPLDQRIREAQPDEPHHCAWSTPTSDVEGCR